MEKTQMDSRITYKEMNASFEKRMKYCVSPSPESGPSYLSDIDDSLLTETERLHVILPVFVWTIRNKLFNDWMNDELVWYFKAYQSGVIQKELEDDPERDEVLRDLTWCFSQIYPDEFRE